MVSDNDLWFTKRDPRNASALGRLKLWSIFRRLWTKDHQVITPAHEKLQFTKPYPFDDILFCSRDIRDQGAKLFEICPKFWCFWAATFFRAGRLTPQISDPILQIRVAANVYQNLVTIDRAISETERKKEKITVKHQQHFRMTCPQHSWRAPIKTVFLPRAEFLGVEWFNLPLPHEMADASSHEV